MSTAHAQRAVSEHDRTTNMIDPIGIIHVHMPRKLLEDTEKISKGGECLLGVETGGGAEREERRVPCGVMSVFPR